MQNMLLKTVIIIDFHFLYTLAYCLAITIHRLQSTVLFMSGSTEGIADSELTTDDSNTPITGIECSINLWYTLQITIIV